MEFNVYKEEFVLSCEEAIEQLEKSLNKPESDKSEKLNRNGDI